jgi:hypothetical protein
MYAHMVEVTGVLVVMRDARARSYYARACRPLMCSCLLAS